MFVNKKELDKVKEDLEGLKDNTAILNERFTAHIQTQKQTTTEHTSKMDEIIGLIKDNYKHTEITGLKISKDLIDRLTREYESTAVVDKKMMDMKNCCRSEFVSKETSDINRTEILKDIRGVRELSKQHANSIRREAGIVLLVITTILSGYIHFVQGVL